MRTFEPQSSALQRKTPSEKMQETLGLLVDAAISRSGPLFCQNKERGNVVIVRPPPPNAEPRIPSFPSASRGRKSEGRDLSCCFVNYRSSSLCESPPPPASSTSRGTRGGPRLDEREREAVGHR